MNTEVPGRQLPDTCGVCGEQYDGDEEVWAQYNWNISNTQVCPECSQKIQWPHIPIYRVRIYDIKNSIYGDERELINDTVTINDEWLDIEKEQPDEEMEVTIVTPRLPHRK